MNKNQSIGMYVILGIMVLAFVSMLFSGPTSSTEELSYTNFLQKIDNKEIKSVDMMKDSDIKYADQLEKCFMGYENVKYYRIKMTEDCSLEEITPIAQTMEERILKTLEAYHLTNNEVLDEIDLKELEEQIEYMKTKIKES